MSLNIIHEKCDPKAAQDKSLPRNAYLVTYACDDKLLHDVVMADGKVDIFDHYWDKYKEGLQSISYAEGNVKPHMWNENKKKPDKKVTRKKK